MRTRGGASAPGCGRPSARTRSTSWAPTEVTSGAFLDNPASLAVSRKVGYRPNGVVRLKRRDGEMALNQKLVLTPGDLRRGDPLEVIGAEDLRSFLGLCEP